MARHQPPAYKKVQSIVPSRPYAEMAGQLAANVRQLISLKHYETAVELLLQLQHIDPGHAEGLLLQAELELATEQNAKAFHSLLAASYQLPDHPRVYALLAELHTRGNQDRAAISALLRCVTLKPRDATNMLRLAALYTQAGLTEQANHWRDQALRAHPYHCINRLKDSQRKLRVLDLKTAESTEWRLNRKTFQTHLSEGHNNLVSLLDREHIEVWTLFVDVMGKSPEVVRKLPKVDLIYNGITDAERCADALKHAQTLCDRLSVPVVNAPSAVLAVSREGNYDCFKDNPDILLPKSVKVEATQERAKAIVERLLKKNSFELPVIIRLAGFQGGKYMHKVEDLKTHDFSELDNELEKQPQTVYVIQYHDVSYIDERLPDTNLYPKYRAFMVDDKLYAVHLFTGPEFNVHLKTANETMQQNAWLIDKERDFCEQPIAHLGFEKWQALESVMREAGLDYNGVDFAIATSPEHKGKLVIFEMNPAMRNWVSTLPEGNHVQQAWRQITLAVHEMFCQKGGIEPWTFNLPKGQPPTLKPEDILTLHLHIQGKVQGVGYRRWLTEQMQSRGIPGWVRNLADGSVEGVIHGKLADLQPFCDAVPNGPENVSVTKLDVTQWEGETPEGVAILDTH